MSDWIKVEKLTPDKPEIAILARKLGVSIGDAFLQWFRVYAWADGVTCPGFVPFLSLADVDQLSRAMARTSEHLASPEIGWMRQASDGIYFSNWDRHNGKSAKSRGLDAEKKRRQRVKSDDLSPICPDANGTISGPDERRARGEPIASFRLSKGDRKAKGSAAAKNGVSAPPADVRSSLSPRSPKSARGEGMQEESFDLSEVDWARVEHWAESVGRKIPPRTTDDRRMWIRFAVLADMSFSEAWLMDSVEAVLRAQETRSTRQAHLVGVLKAKAGEDHGVDEATFLAMLGRIEIPAKVWKSGVLEIRK